MKKLLFILFFGFFNFKSYTAGPGYLVDTISSGYTTLKSCINSSTGDIDPTVECPYNTVCQLIPSSRDEGSPMAVCAKPTMEMCKMNSDCLTLGASSCVIHERNQVLLSKLRDQGSLNADQVGICLASGGSSEDNVLGDALCKGISIVTGKAGRGFIAVMIIVIGILFFTGKISWNMVLSVGLGTGAIFGAPSVVALITGKPFACKSIN